MPDACSGLQRPVHKGSGHLMKTVTTFHFQVRILNEVKAKPTLTLLSQMMSSMNRSRASLGCGVRLPGSSDDRSAFWRSSSQESTGPRPSPAGQYSVSFNDGARALISKTSPGRQLHLRISIDGSSKSWKPRCWLNILHKSNKAWQCSFRTCFRAWSFFSTTASTTADAYSKSLMGLLCASHSQLILS